MRITSDMSQRHVLSDLRRVQERLANAQSQVSSGKRIEKPSEQVAVGSTIALPRQGRVKVLKVLALPARRGPAREAQACYENLPD